MRDEEVESPLERLYPFQRRIVTDDSQFKILSCSRQVGKSTLLACESAMDCCKYRNSKWLCVSTTQRQAGEWLLKAKAFSKAWCLFCSARGLPVAIDKATQTEIHFSNGSRILTLPANQGTIRGYDGNVILDEFAHHENPEAIYNSILPTISTEPFGRKLKIRIASTVSGMRNLFWKILNGESGYEHWSCHTVTVEDAVKEEFPIDIAALKAGLAEEVFNQEYMCQPVDLSNALLSMENIIACESPGASEYFDDVAMDESGKRFAIGMDIGRRHNLTVLWTVEIGVNNKLTTREVKVLENIQLEEQQSILFEKLKRQGVDHCTIDSTGIGLQLAENAKREFGSKVTPFVFTEQSKRELFVRMLSTFQKQQIEIPISEKIREDLNSMQRLFTANGKVLYSAPNNADGHADRATACALAIDAASRAGVRAMSCSPRPNGWYSIPSDDNALPSLEQMMGPHEYIF